MLITIVIFLLILFDFDIATHSKEKKVCFSNFGKKSK